MKTFSGFTTGKCLAILRSSLKSFQCRVPKAGSADWRNIALINSKHFGAGCIESTLSLSSRRLHSVSLLKSWKFLWCLLTKWEVSLPAPFHAVVQTVEWNGMVVQWNPSFQTNQKASKCDFKRRVVLIFRGSFTWKQKAEDRTTAVYRGLPSGWFVFHQGPTEFVVLIDDGTLHGLYWGVFWSLLIASLKYIVVLVGVSGISPPLLCWTCVTHEKYFPHQI